MNFVPRYGVLYLGETCWTQVFLGTGIKVHKYLCLGMRSLFFILPGYEISWWQDMVCFVKEKSHSINFTT
jgi:hypothetical protein